MNTLLLELIVIVGLLVWPPADGKENKCKTEFEMSCVKRVSCLFNEKIIEEKREFRIEYKPSGQSEEVIADCQWRNEQFSCDPVKGFMCDQQPSNNFSVVIDTEKKCLKDGEIRFDVAHEQLIRCELSNDEDAADINIKLNTTQATIQTSDSGDDDNSVTAGVIAGVVIGSLVISAVVAIWFWKRRCRKSRTNRVTKDKNNVGKIDDIEKQECQMFMDQGVAVNVPDGGNRRLGYFSIVSQFCVRSTENKPS